MSDFVISQIRTYVPMLAGAIVSWLALNGVQLDSNAALALGSFLTALFGAVYYLVVRLLEARWPQVGVLLGKAKTPVY